jgi:hypothetical protein
MHASHAIRAVEIGDGAGHLQSAMKSTRGQPKCCGRLAQQTQSSVIRHRNLLQQLPRAIGVGAHAHRCRAERREPRPLDAAGPRHAQRNLSTSLARRRQYQVRRRDLSNLDLQVDAVEERPRQPRLIVGGAAWAALAGLP